MRQVTKQVIRKDLDHDIAKWSNRSYAISASPKITATDDGFTAEFPMTYTLTNSKGTSSGKLGITVRVRSQAETWQVSAIQRTTVQAATKRSKLMHVYEVRPRKDKRGVNLMSRCVSNRSCVVWPANKMMLGNYKFRAVLCCSVFVLGLTPLCCANLGDTPAQIRARYGEVIETFGDTGPKKFRFHRPRSGDRYG
jgi:hypothetical protein